MRLGILSDTHNELDRTRRAIELLLAEGATAFVHCGDLSTPAIVELLPSKCSWFVLGNHDSDTAADLRSAAANTDVTCLQWGGVIELAGKRIGVAHGHLSTDLRRVLSEHPDYFLFGHTHVPMHATVNSIRKINPGALHRVERLTVALLEIASGELRFIELGTSGFMQLENANSVDRNLAEE